MRSERAVARASDPWTSWAAARGIDVKPSQRAVLWLFEQYGPMTLEEVVDGAEHARVPFSPSRLRTACSELVDVGLLEVTDGVRATRRGRAARVLARGRPARIADAGQSSLF